MAGTPSPGGIATFREAANWLVGLSAAGITAALTFYDKIAQAPMLVRVALMGCVLCLLVSILAGVQYSFWLNYQANQSGREKYFRRLLAATPASPDAPTWTTKADTAATNVVRAQNHTNVVHYLSLWSFAGGIVLAALLLGTGLFAPVEKAEQKKEEKPADRFLLSTQVMYGAGKRGHSHTFLLNEVTGEVWEMVCLDGKNVQFRAVVKGPAK